ncbi:MAG: hypothetical protein AAFV07_03330 [Bacteroidota bacterium]
MQQKGPYIAWVGINAIIYGWLLYATPRTAFGTMILMVMSLFGMYGLMIWPRIQNRLFPFSTGHSLSLAWILGGAFLLRLLAAGALPQLSDDYFRFIWDGQLWTLGTNPFRYLPKELMLSGHAIQDLPLSDALFAGMNSPEYFTIYPPVLQAIFWLGAKLSPDSIMGAVWIMKASILLAEAGTLWLLVKVLERQNLPQAWLLIYAFNPLIIIELSGNLHFEALMICFSLGSVYLLQQGKWWQSALVFALAICSKLLPVLWLPLLLRRLGWGKAILYGLISGMATLIMFLPMFDLETLQHLSASVGLYFQTFEFNASIWYIVRAIGYEVVGYNIIQKAGSYMALATLFMILLYTFLERKPTLKNLPQGMLWAMSLYFLMASIVHPWYISTLVLLATLTTYRWPLVWSLMAFLTYSTYAQMPYAESLWIVGIEYSLVSMFLGWELWKRFSHQAV